MSRKYRPSISGFSSDVGNNIASSEVSVEKAISVSLITVSDCFLEIFGSINIYDNYSCRFYTNLLEPFYSESSN